jgi:predicted dehydrogenase
MQRGAIIGLGNVALHGHLPGWRRRHDVEIVAVTDARPEQHALVSAHAPAARWYATPAQLLAEAAVDFVDICTPPSSHAPLIRQALERGRHVLCEKPLVSAPEDLAPVACSTPSTTGTTRRSCGARRS